MNRRATKTIERAAIKGIAAAAALFVVCGPAAARPRALSLMQVEQEAEPIGPAQDQLIPAQRGGGISLADATARALSVFPGRVAGARPVQMGDRVVYEIRIVGEDGRTIRTFRIDAQTGAFL